MPPDSNPPNEKRVVVMPAYNAARTLETTCTRIPTALAAHVLVCDDGSSDDTVTAARRLGLEVLVHPENRGYGGAQKTLYARALSLGATTVVMLHPDNQYEAEKLVDLVHLVEEGGHDYALGSRIADGRAMSRGMPPWKYLANRALTTAQNRAFGTSFTDLHTGLRAYRAATLEQVPWKDLPDDFAFDCEMLVELAARGMRGAETAVGSWYFPEASSVDAATSVRYGTQVLKSLARYARLRNDVRNERASR